MTSTDVQTENTTFWFFTKDEILTINELGLKGGLRLRDFRNTILHPIAWKTLGFEVWLRDIRKAFRQRLLQTVKERIEGKALLDRLETLARDLDDQISQMLDKETDPSEPPQPVERALLIRAKNKKQAEEAVRYLRAAEVALGQVVPVHRTSPDSRDRAGAFYLPAIKTYHRQRARYLARLADSPGTPFYAAHPPKRKLEADWYPAGRRRRYTRRAPPWRPIYRPWAVEGRDVTGEANEWDNLESRIAERNSLKRRADELVGERVTPLGPERALLPAAPPPTPAKPDVTRQTDQEEEVEEDEDEQYEVRSDDSLFCEKSPVTDPTTIPAADEAGDGVTGDDQPGNDQLSYEPSEAEEYSFKPQLTKAERKGLRPLQGQNTSYQPPILPRIKLPIRNGGPSWKDHHDELQLLLDQALARGYWDNFLNDPTAAQAVARIAAEVEALVPAARAVRDFDEEKGLEKCPTLGYDEDLGMEAGIEAARFVVGNFFRHIRPFVRAIPRFKWRSQQDYAIGFVDCNDTRYKGRVGVV